MRSEIHERVLTAETLPDLMEAYATWANDYDKNLVDDWGYTAHISAANLLAAYQKDRTVAVLDAGCGTGLVGALLKEAGFNKICGADYSSEMLAVSEKKSIYENLIKINLNEKLHWPDRTFGCVISSGAFTSSHIQINAFRELVRITKQDGFVCITARDSYWEQEPFMELLATMQVERRIEIHEIFTADYIKSEGAKCKIFLVQVL